MNNVVTARLSSRDRIIETPPLYQYDYGQILKFTEVDLPATYEVHFGNSPFGNAVTVLGDENGVAIPDVYLTTGDAVHAWLFLHTGTDDGETMYHVMVPVRMRPAVTDEPPTPVELSIITQTIAALNSGVEHVNEVVNGVEQTINNALTEAKQSGEFDGFSPIVEISSIQGGHRITITDKNETRSANIMDGERGTPGQDGYSPSISIHKVFHTAYIAITDKHGTTETEIHDGDPDYLIDDTLYGRVLNRTWSIGKLGDTFLPKSAKGASGGLAELDQNGRVPASQLPSYVDDVVDGYMYNGHFYEDTQHQHEIVGESGKVYIDNNTNITYRWGGQSFVPIGSDLALGETSSTAYRGDRGKIAYDHANDANRLTSAQITGLYKIAVSDEGHIAGVTPVQMSDLVDLGVAENPVIDVQIAGSSIVNNGIASIPKANNNTFGLVKVDSNSGLNVTAGDGIIKISIPTDEDMKQGTTNNAVVTPGRQHRAVFYGLAKAAGDTTQTRSSNAVGAYTAEAKSAIKTMLGVVDPTVSDVRIGETSTVSDGIASIPVGGNGTLGVVKTYNGAYGIDVVYNDPGNLMIHAAPSEHIKLGNSYYLPIVPQTQHEAVFFGLSKAAGYNLRNVGNVVVGTYPEESKVAIREMIGASKVNIATDEMVRSIIDDYPYEGDEEDVVFIANYVDTQSNNDHYETEDDASDIADAYKSGKHVVIKFHQDNTYDRFASVVGLADEHEEWGSTVPAQFVFDSDSNSASLYPINMSSASVTNEGKLAFYLFWD